jgi:Ser/Thr protein kinase RdoA (MazF antagonist)
VLKIANLDEDRSFLECQLQAMATVEAAGVPVQHARPSLDGDPIVAIGDPGPPWARVMTWLPGRIMAAAHDPDPTLWVDLGSLMGRVATALADFHHPAARRHFQWDVLQAGSVIAGGVDAIDDAARTDVLTAVASRLRTDLVPRLATLRRSVIHNDANDHNILVDATGTHVAGLLDFGDMVHSVTAQEAAVTAAYAMFGAQDPAAALRAVTRGFDGACPLTADELDALPSLVLARLAASVAISAVQARLAPDPYLRVSEEPAWRVIEWLMAEPPARLRFGLHEAVGR